MRDVFVPAEECVPLLGRGVTLIEIGRTRDVVKPWRIVPVFRVEPVGTCLICLGVGGCGYRAFIPCWACRS